MRAQRPLSDAHLAEAVRRGVITTDQMEALLALARSGSPSEGALPDLRWTHVIVGLASAIAVVVPGMTMLIESHDGDEVALAGGCAVALVACALASHVVRRRGWGRAPAAILMTGVAPYAGGLALFATFRGLSSLEPATRANLSFLLGPLVATASAIVLWRALRVGPALAIAGFFLPFVAMCAARLAHPSEAPTPHRLLVVAVVLASLAAAALRPSWGRRNGVDGTSWWELGTFAIAAIIGTAGFSNGLGGLSVWLPAALVTGLAGLWFRRWTYQLTGLLGSLWFLWLGVRSEPKPTQAAGLVAVALLVAVATQWQRRREARHVAPRESFGYWE